MIYPNTSQFECVHCNRLGQYHTFTAQNLQPPGLPQRQGAQLVSAVITTIQPPDSVSEKIQSWSAYYRQFEEFPSSSKTHIVNAAPYDPETRIRRIPRLSQEDASLLLQSRSSLEQITNNPAINQRPQNQAFNHMEARINEQIRPGILNVDQQTIQEHSRHEYLNQTIHPEPAMNGHIRTQPQNLNRIDSTGSDQSRPPPLIQPIIIPNPQQIQPISIPNPQPQLRPIPQPLSQASIKPVAQPSIQPPSQSHSDPVSQLVHQPLPISQPANQPGIQPASQYISQPNPQPLPFFGSKPIQPPSQLISQPASHPPIQPIPPPLASNHSESIRRDQYNPQPPNQPSINPSPVLVDETRCNLCSNITDEFAMIYLECGHQVCRNCMHNQVLPIGIQNNFRVICLKCSNSISDEILSANIDRGYYDYYLNAKRSLI